MQGKALLRRTTASVGKVNGKGSCHGMISYDRDNCTGRLNINTYTYKSKNLKNRKLKRKRKQKRKRGSLREGREAPPRRCPHPFRFCFRFRFNFRFFKFLFLYVYVLIFNRPVHVILPYICESSRRLLVRMRMTVLIRGFQSTR